MSSELRFWKFLRRRLADYVKEMYLHACCTCSTVIFPYSSNHITSMSDCCIRHFLNTLIAWSFHFPLLRRKQNVLKCVQQDFFNKKACFVASLSRLPQITWPSTIFIPAAFHWQNSSGAFNFCLKQITSCSVLFIFCCVC